MTTSGVLDSQPREQFLPNVLGKLHQAPQVIHNQLKRLPFWGQSEPTCESPPMEQVLGIYGPQAISMPIFGQNVWEEQTGREFIESPSLVDALVDTGLQVLAQKPDDENPWIEWASRVENAGDLLDGESIHTWTGTSRIQGYGSQAPWIKIQAIVPFAPTLLAQLLMDSKRVQSYHTRPAARKDLWVNLAGASSTKISRHGTQAPLGWQTDYFSLLHARPVPEENKEPVDNVNPSWLVVSRAVGGKAWLGASESESKIMSQSPVLLDVKLLEAVPGRPSATLMTTISHVYHKTDEPSGLEPAVQFIKNLRELYAKQKRGPMPK